jgi:UDP-N-acetylmuramate dehydrogenase
MALEVRPGPRLADRTTLRLGGRTLAEVVLTGPDDVAGLTETLAGLGGTPLVLGGGSNLLARDGELPLVVVSPRLVGEPQTLRERFGGAVRVRVGAGVKLQRLVAWLATQGLAGLAGLVGVPGTVGGAVAGNAGSYGCDLGSVLARVQVWTPGRGLFWLGRDGFTTGYRHFAPTGNSERFVVLAAEIDCAVDEPIAIRRTMIELLRRKRASQPIKAASAGCVFKNPADVSAGRLLDAAGFRGRRQGGMAFSDIHANFLVNLGGGTGTEALELIETAREAVRRRSGHELELEVRVAP